VIGGGLVGIVRHKRRLVRPHTPHVLEVMAQERIAFDIKFSPSVARLLQQRGQIIDIMSADVALIRPRMHRNAMGPGIER
jgi:hypothetical protein